MKDFIGVESWLSIGATPSPLKREALIFHEIAIPFLGDFLRILEHARLLPDDSINEIQWLLEQRVIYEPKNELDDERLQACDEFQAYSQLESKLRDELEEYKEQGGLSTFLRIFNTAYKDIPVPEQLRRELHDFAFRLVTTTETRSRLVAIQLRELQKLDAFPVLHSGINPLPISKADKSDIVQIVINALPVPDDSTPWEQIREFREEPDSQAKFLDLRNWMNEVTRLAHTPIEVEQKLEYLMSQYQRRMELHKIKTNTGTMETIIVTGAEFLEGLVRLQFSKTARALFSLKHRRIALIEGELTSPGSEVAYVIKAKETFSDS